MLGYERRCDAYTVHGQAADARACRDAAPYTPQPIEAETTVAVEQMEPLCASGERNQG